MNKRNAGFTLIEILVALLIFAIIGVVTAISLHEMLNSNDKLKVADRRIMQMQVAMTLLRSDLMQMINRPIIDSDGNKEPAFEGSGGDSITFTRTGLVNPFQMSRRSNMQRIGYTVQGDDLVRLTWDALDQPPHMKAQVQPVLTGVQSLQWQFVASDGKKTNSWPPTTGSNLQEENPIAPLPAAVLLVMKVAGEGTIEGAFPVPARGFDATAQ